MSGQFWVCDQEGRYTFDEPVDKQQIMALATEIIEDTPVSELVNSPRRCVEYFTVKLHDKEIEEFHVLYLNAKSRVITSECVALGTVNSCYISPREIVKGALRHNAVSVILFHNHPSGDAEPSERDKVLTKELQTTLALVGVDVKDHIIVCKGVYESFSQNGLL